MIYDVEEYLDNAVGYMATTIVDAQVVLDDDEDGAEPADLRTWLSRLRLLEGVPFANLVADSELLPPESIRWFYLDRRWTDALVQGALAVGTVNSDDRAHLDAQYPAIRAELDAEERNRRRRPDEARRGGPPAPVSGFLLRSAAVSGWPGLHVRAFDFDPAQDGDPDTVRIPEDAPGRIRLLRLERLAPAVLLCLFDGIPKLVHIEEPRQGVQFGFDVDDADSVRRVTLRPRSKETFEYIEETPDTPIDLPIPVPFRSGASGVVDIQELERQLATLDETGAGDALDSAEYALQLVRFPWRQVFGDEVNDDVRSVFRPTIGYRTMVSTTFLAEVDDV